MNPEFSSVGVVTSPCNSYEQLHVLSCPRCQFIFESQMGKSPDNSYQDAAVVIEFNNQSIMIPKDVSLTVSVLKDGKPVRGAVIPSHILAHIIKNGLDDSPEKYFSESL